MVLEDYKTIQLRGKTVFAKAVFNDFERMPKYFTADEACFMIVSQGFFSLRTPDKVIGFRQGEGMLAKCGPYFVERPAAEAAAPLTVMATYFHPELVKPLFPAELSLAHFQPGYDVRNFPMDEMLGIFMQGVDFLLENPGVCTDDLILTKVRELLLLLAQSDQAASVQQFVAALFAPYEYDFRQTVLKNAHSNLSLPEFARLCNMSLATFKRRFSEAFGESPARFFAHEKLKKAASMLGAQPDARISDIVYDCGFDTVTHFNKMFKKAYGQSPSAYRLSQKAKPVSR